MMPAQKLKGLSQQADYQDPSQPHLKHNNILKLNKIAF